jgi:hypothetical protein
MCVRNSTFIKLSFTIEGANEKGVQIFYTSVRKLSEASKCKQLAIFNNDLMLLLLF